MCSGINFTGVACRFEKNDIWRGTILETRLHGRDKNTRNVLNIQSLECKFP